ncbi:hypothetical protein [Streptomyces sp. 2A115]|uniref:hypothetical protein n=1 Tax=Streptomyces sp. 2A115 TaxID=3457439 RepID=UPI003FD41441
MRARFVSYDRTEGEFPATVSFRPGPALGVRITVADFNELDEQLFTGYAFGRGGIGLAGKSDWKGQPFGFFARRHPPYTLGPLLPGPVRPADFAGRFNLYCDGAHGTLTLTKVPGGTIRGVLREDGGAELPVTVRVDQQTPYQALITIHGPEPEPTLSVWMFSRQRCALTGWLDWDGVRLGCYLTRCAWRQEFSR